MENKVVILEGFHACKHAVRFGADIIELVTADNTGLEVMLQKYAPDIRDEVLNNVRQVSSEEFSNYSNIEIRTPLAGKVYVPTYSEHVPEPKGASILLDNPRDLENIGAVVRLAAGMGCWAVYTTGEVDPWHKNCIRGSQGLHFALPVMKITYDDLENMRGTATLVAFDEAGEDLIDFKYSQTNTILAFGSERRGLTDKLRRLSHATVKIPQREGVSSYNLATSVAIGVYHYVSNH